MTVSNREETMPTITTITPSEIRKGDIIETAHDTVAYNITSGKSRPVRDVRRYVVVEVAEPTVRSGVVGVEVRVQTVANAERVAAGGRALIDSLRFTGHPEFTYRLVSR